MKRTISLILVLMMIIPIISVYADNIDWNKEKTATIEVRLTDGTIGKQTIKNNGGIPFEQGIEFILQASWNDAAVVEIVSLNGIPLKDTKFSKYAGVIDSERKYEGWRNDPEVIKGAQESEALYKPAVVVNQPSSQGSSQPAQNKEIEIKVNGIKVNFDVAPYNKDGRVFVPFRAIFEALGAEVDYDFSNPFSKLVWAVRKVNGEDVKVSMKIGSKVAVKAGKQVNMDVAPEIKQGRTFIPVRYASEFLGMKVEWVQETKEVLIYE